MEIGKGSGSGTYARRKQRDAREKAITRCVLLYEDVCEEFEREIGRGRDRSSIYPYRYSSGYQPCLATVPFHILRGNLKKDIPDQNSLDRRTRR